MPRPLLKTFGIGLFTAAIGMLISPLPAGHRLEQEFGLHPLFDLRGQRPAPGEVVIVEIDEASAGRLGLQSTSRWPRELHARLVEELTDARAAVIVFDIHFKQPRDRAEDRALAAAMRRAGNVVLYAYLDREIVNAPARQPDITVERLQPPAPVLAAASVASAPLTLPSGSAEANQFWTFRRAAGDVPSLPAVSLQLFSMDAYQTLLPMLGDLRPEFTSHLPRTANSGLTQFGLTELMLALRTLFTTQPSLAPAVLDALQRETSPVANPDDQRRIRALIDLYSGDALRYLNFYGPPHSIDTLSYADVLHDTESLRADLQGKAVFVGFADTPSASGFRTVFSREDGSDVSSVEIAATAFANLLEGSSLTRPEPAVFAALLAIYGLATAALCLLPSAASAIVATVALAAIYFGWCYFLFLNHGTWLPSAVPVLVQTPLAFCAALLWRQWDAHRERRRIHHAFGYYLPDSVVDQLARNADWADSPSRKMFGVCLVIDAPRGTRPHADPGRTVLSESMSRYYKVLLKPVLDHGGVVSELIGDAMLAVWSAPGPVEALRIHACRAALDIARAVEHLDRPAGSGKLSAHIGLHASLVPGEKLSRQNRAGDQAMNDIIDAAAAIQTLNLRLGTRVLVSNECLAGLDCFLARGVGVFSLPGVGRKIELHELLCLVDDSSAELRALRADFAAALAAYHAEAWPEAACRLARILEKFPDDGPSLYYLHGSRLSARKPALLPGNGRAAA